MLITDLAVFELPKGAKARLIQLAPGVTAEEIAAKTDAAYDVALKAGR
jgi:3-oxoacid CoA-transferase subunit B